MFLVNLNVQVERFCKLFINLIVQGNSVLGQLLPAKYTIGLIMPRLSLYRANKQNDYKFIDRTIAEMYQVGGVDIYIHKYLGPKAHGDDSSSINGGVQDATQPSFSSESPLLIEDLFLLENRDRSYDSDIHVLRGVYTVSDIDFNLTQFGLFLQNDTLFITFHINNMINVIGRKLMNGDVLELPNLKDYYPLDTSLPKALPKYYVIQDASNASEGFSVTWYPHLWRVKAVPLVAAQEYNDVLKNSFATDDIWDQDRTYPSGTVVLVGSNYYRAKQNVPASTSISNTAYWESYVASTIQDILGTRAKDIEVNDAILTQAEVEVPLSGYDNTRFYVVPNDKIYGTSTSDTPESFGYVQGYLAGATSGLEPPNGLPVASGISFPPNPSVGNYVLRLDYYPNRLFRFDGIRWVKVTDEVRTNLTPGATNHTQRSNFVNNTATVTTVDRGNIPSRQGLSNILKPEADN